MAKLQIITDSREQNRWEFDPAVAVATVACLSTGDYTVHGFESLLCIERKASVSEFAHNLREPRWQEFIGRMGEYPFKYFIMEFGVEEVLQYPRYEKMPKAQKMQVRFGGKYLLREMMSIQVHHGIPIIFAGSRDNAAEVALSIMKRVVSHDNDY